MEDQKIIALYWDRSESAITETAEKYGRYCQSVARNILQDEEDVAECVNDAYLRAWNSIPPHRPENLRTFLGKITRNLALNRYEKQAAEKRGNGQTAVALEELLECIPSRFSTEQIMDRLVLTEALNRFLAEQKPDARRIFVSRYWYLRSVREISKMYGMTESKVTVTLTRTRQRLHRFLKKEGILP